MTLRLAKETIPPILAPILEPPLELPGSSLELPESPLSESPLAPVVSFSNNAAAPLSWEMESCPSSEQDETWVYEWKSFDAMSKKPTSSITFFFFAHKSLLGIVILASTKTPNSMK